MGNTVFVGIEKVSDRVERDVGSDVGSLREGSSRECGSPEAVLKQLRRWGTVPKSKGQTGKRSLYSAQEWGSQSVCRGGGGDISHRGFIVWFYFGS